MAVQKQQIVDPIWAEPAWPDRLPRAADLRLVYGDEADELVILFDRQIHREPVFIWVTTPDIEYAAIKVDTETAEVIGVMVYPLLAYAVEEHRSWQAAAEPNPSPAVAERIVRDVRNLFDRFGIEPVFNEAP